MPQRPDRPKIAIVLSGGGARGAYQVGVLKALAEAVGNRPIPFRIVTGISVGAINTLALACRAHDFASAVETLERLWRGLHCRGVFRTDMRAIAARLSHWAGHLALGRFGLRPPQSLLDNSPLRDLLTRELDARAMRAMLGRGLLDAVAITASSYRTGQAVTFFQCRGKQDTWARSRREGRPCVLGVDHVLASTALPFVFPAQRIDGAYYGDGALRQTSPLSPAIHLGAEKLFVIAGRDGHIDAEAGPGTVPEYPSTGLIAGQLLDIVFNDQLETDIERLTRINGTLARLGPAQLDRSALRPIDLLAVQPSEDIRDLTARHLRDMPWTVKAVVKGLGGWKPPFVLPSYLMFEPGYIGALIDLGAADGRARIDEIRGFLDLDTRRDAAA